MKHFLVILSLFVSGLTAFAQSSPGDANPVNPELEKTIVDFTRQFYRSFEEAVNSKNGNLEPVMKHMDKSYSMTRHIIDVNNKITKSSSNLNEFRTQTAAQASLAGFSISFNIDRINFVMAYDNIATISYSVWVNAQLNGEQIVRFRSHVTNYMRKDEQGNWKIFESTGLNIYKEQEMGLCPCGITQVNPNQYTVKILYPSGNSFNTDNLVFDFKPGKQKTLILMGNNAYTLDNGEVTCVKENGKQVTTKLGKAASSVEAVSLILSSHLYTSRCMGFKAIEKK